MIYRPTPVTEAKGRIIDVKIKSHILEVRKNLGFSASRLGKNCAILLDIPEFCRGGARIEAVQRRIAKLENDASALGPV